MRLTVHLHRKTMETIRRVAKALGTPPATLIRMVLISSLQAGPSATSRLSEDSQPYTIPLPDGLALSLWEQSKTRRVSRGAIVRGILESVDWDRLEQDIQSGEFYRRLARGDLGR